eukprot:m.361802 g.361802  ORF g.361802 m.361802 type:complete len:655 (-) comp20783_c0_seq1:374-2338(-)
MSFIGGLGELLYYFVYKSTIHSSEVVFQSPDWRGLFANMMYLYLLALATCIPHVASQIATISASSCAVLGWDFFPSAGSPAVAGVCAESTVGGLCPSPATTFGSALAQCLNDGGRLCTATEVNAEATTNSGCGLNTQYVWTSTPCTAAGGLDGFVAAHGDGLDGGANRCDIPSSTVNFPRCCADTVAAPLPVLTGSDFVEIYHDTDIYPGTPAAVVVRYRTEATIDTLQVQLKKGTLTVTSTAVVVSENTPETTAVFTYTTTGSPPDTGLKLFMYLTPDIFANRVASFTTAEDIESFPVTGAPTFAPSDVPTDAPTNVPTTQAPTATPTTAAPSDVPSDAPTDVPSDAPSDVPSDVPSSAPSDVPTDVPSDAPSDVPSDAPSDAPSDIPTDAPSDVPTDAPSDAPSDVPSDAPSDAPSDVPSDAPTDAPTGTPTTAAPTDTPTDTPTGTPTTTAPTGIPTDAPSGTPTTAAPTNPPSFRPTASPVVPTFSPTAAPFAIPEDPFAPTTGPPSTGSPTPPPVGPVFQDTTTPEPDTTTDGAVFRGDGSDSGKGKKGGKDGKSGKEAKSEKTAKSAKSEKSADGKGGGKGNGKGKLTDMAASKKNSRSVTTSVSISLVVGMAVFAMGMAAYRKLAPVKRYEYESIEQREVDESAPLM